MNDEIYIFLDESGDFDFTQNGTAYLCFSGLCVKRPFDFYHEFNELKYDLISSANITKSGNSLEYFHCSEGTAETKSKVFSLVEKYKSKFEVFSIAIPKNKVKKEFREFKKFYPLVITSIISNIVTAHAEDGNLENRFVFITDQIPEKNKIKSIEKSLKTSLAKLGVRYRIIHHQSKSHIGLQVIDYISWAVNQKVKLLSKNRTCGYFERISDIIELKILEENDLPN